MGFFFIVISWLLPRKVDHVLGRTLTSIRSYSPLTDLKHTYMHKRELAITTFQYHEQWAQNKGHVTLAKPIRTPLIVTFVSPVQASRFVHWVVGETSLLEYHKFRPTTTAKEKNSWLQPNIPPIMATPMLQSASMKTHDLTEIQHNRETQTTLPLSSPLVSSTLARRRRKEVAVFVKVLLDYLARCDRSSMERTKKVSRTNLFVWNFFC